MHISAHDVQQSTETHSFLKRPEPEAEAEAEVRCASDAPSGGGGGGGVHGSPSASQRPGKLPSADCAFINSFGTHCSTRPSGVWCSPK